jgi:hypothetical protein
MRNFGPAPAAFRNAAIALCVAVLVLAIVSSWPSTIARFRPTVPDPGELRRGREDYPERTG